MDEQAIMAWGHFLADIPAPELAKAVEHWVKTEERQPTVAGILKLVSVSEGTDAEAAWERAIKIVTHGKYRGADRRELPFGFTRDPALEQAVKVAGGWVNIGQMAPTQLAWAKKEFVAAYAQAALAPSRTALPSGPLPARYGDGLPLGRPVQQNDDAQAAGLAKAREAVARGKAVMPLT